MRRLRRSPGDAQREVAEHDHRGLTLTTDGAGTTSDRQRVLVVGVGNELLGDEGLGVHVARTLLARRDCLPGGADVIEAGTALLDLLGELPRYRRVILVDAVRAGGEPGTVYRAELTGSLVADGEQPPALSLHEWSLFEALRAARLLGLLPAEVSLIGAEPHTTEPGLRLSPALERAARRIATLLEDELLLP